MTANAVNIDPSPLAPCSIDHPRLRRTHRRLRSGDRAGLRRERARRGHRDVHALLRWTILGQAPALPSSTAPIAAVSRRLATRRARCSRSSLPVVRRLPRATLANGRTRASPAGVMVRRLARVATRIPRGPRARRRTAADDRPLLIGLRAGDRPGARLGDGGRRQRPSAPPLVELEPHTTKVTLYLQRWRLRTPSLDRLAEAIVAGACARFQHGDSRRDRPPAAFSRGPGRRACAHLLLPCGSALGRQARRVVRRRPRRAFRCR
jgi:hypothetical protein